MPKSPDKLKQRRTRFVKEYLTGKDKFNQSAAAIAAGYSEKGASVTGNRLLKDPKVIAEMSQLEQKINNKLDITVERIRLEMARLAFFDPAKMFNEDGSPKKLSEIDEDTRRCIGGIDVAELFTGSGEERMQAGVIKKFKICDKNKALESLARTEKMFTDKMEISADEEIVAKLMAARRRIGK